MPDTTARVDDSGRCERRELAERPEIDVHQRGLEAGRCRLHQPGNRHRDGAHDVIRKPDPDLAVDIPAPTLDMTVGQDPKAEPETSVPARGDVGDTGQTGHELRGRTIRR